MITGKRELDIDAAIILTAKSFKKARNVESDLKKILYKKKKGVK